jgi:2'-5' RNA ligase
MCFRTQPFVVRIGNIGVFPRTSVIYLELEAGQRELEDLHLKFGTDALAFDEPYPFHPHITLAQNFDAGTVAERRAEAQSKWDAYRGPREFLLDRVVFVQNSSNNCWIDLKSYELRGLPVAPAPSATTELSRTY